MKENLELFTAYPTINAEVPAALLLCTALISLRYWPLAGQGDPPEVMVLGVEPSDLGWSMELSPQAAEALLLLIGAVKRELKRK